MSVAEQISVIERFRQGTRASDFQGAVVPVEDTFTFLVITREIVNSLIEDDSGSLVLIVDAKTAEQVSALKKAYGVADTVHIFGALPAAWAEDAAGTSCVAHDPLEESGQFFVALSATFSFAVLVASNRTQDAEGNWSKGLWTSLRPHVVRLVDQIGDMAGTRLVPPESPAMRVDPEDKLLAENASLKVMGALIRHYTSREKDVIRSKSDLSSVLEILKSISANRRAHDVLYAFVEQIASVIEIDRCSVVRVWGDERTGHVLASHEDESVNDLVIDLEKYPEIGKCIETRQKVLINNVLDDPLTQPFASQLEAAGIRSLLVIPIVLLDENVGSFFLRAARRGMPLTVREVNFCEIVAEAAANALERAHLFDSIQKANQRLEHLAVTDGLTGLYNHRFFRDRLQEEFDRAIRYDLPLCCALIDIDDFKKINDTYGHLKGDEVLRSLAATTDQCVRKSDIVARYGGEELVVIMPQTDGKGAINQTRRLLETLRKVKYQEMPEDFHVTVSIGIGVLDSATMADCDVLVREADDQLYKAKSTGKNRIVYDGNTYQ